MKVIDTLLVQIHHLMDKGTMAQRGTGPGCDLGPTGIVNVLHCQALSH